MKCNKCGAENKAGALFCKGCGNNLTKEEQRINGNNLTKEEQRINGNKSNVMCCM